MHVIGASYAAQVNLLKSKAVKVQEVACAVLAKLTADKTRGIENVGECATHGGIRLLVALLESSSVMARGSQSAQTNLCNAPTLPFACIVVASSWARELCAVHR